MADGGRGQDERRVRAVRGADPAQPAQHVGDVGAEDAAVDVALVDHHEPQPPQERRPARVPQAGSSGAACRGWSAHRRARGPSRAPAVGCRRRRSPPARPAGPRAAATELVGGQCLGRGPGRARWLAVRQQGRQHRQLIGQRLAGAVPVATTTSGWRGPARPRLLVLPWTVYPAGLETVHQQVRGPVRPLRGPPGTSRNLLDVGHRIMPAAGQER